VEIVTEAAQFPEKEQINGIFVAVWLRWFKVIMVKKMKRVAILIDLDENTP
jgi:hypothetical protein